MSSDSAGLEILFCSVQNKISEPQDALVCALHWSLIKSGFKCLGLGEKARDGATERASEMLPHGWCDSHDVYIIRYKSVSEKKHYQLKVIVIDRTLLVHLMRCNDEKVATLNVSITHYATHDLDSFDSVYKHIDELNSKVKTELLGHFKAASPGTSRATTNRGQRSHVEDDDDADPLRVPSRHPRGGRHPPDWIDPGAMDPFSIGHGDLTPLGRVGGGGMVLDPFHTGGHGRLPPRVDPSAGLPRGLPRGAVPPGARFDPFGPPGTRPVPDPDHLPPPPGADDMFM